MEDRKGLTWKERIRLYAERNNVDLETAALILLDEKTHKKKPGAFKPPAWKRRIRAG